MDLDEVAGIVGQIQNYTKTHQLEFYKPYGFQKEFHYARGQGEFVPVPSDPDNKGLAIHRALMCANQIGKSFCGGRETAYHLTGLYPNDWDGHKFSHPVEVICSSNTNETTRDRCQRELFGDPSDQDALGTGAIPKHLIGETTRKAGVPNAWETVMVKHVSGGWSKAYFKPYEQGPKKFMGYKLHAAWCDEEPPSDIWSQILRALLASDGIAYITFTPEEGVTQVVHSFMNDLKSGQALITATWDDAPHMTKEKIKQKLDTLPEHEREMRSKGIPLMGSGLVWPVTEEQILVDPVEIQPWWPRINGNDFGWEHPFATAFLAWDRETDIIYVYDEFRQSHSTIATNASAIKHKGDWIPNVWPHDGMKKDPKSGKPLAELYRQEGLYMHHEPFSNPPAPGQEEGKGGNGVEVGIIHILERMQTGRFKVFKTCTQWIEEWRMYHRQNGEIVKFRDDLMSATRYGVMMIRHAITRPVASRPQQTLTGLSNW